MSEILAVVLYEDSRADGARNFGPHSLVVACVADRVGIERYQLKSRLLGVPKNGAAKVRTVCEGEGGPALA